MGQIELTPGAQWQMEQQNAQDTANQPEKSKAEEAGEEALQQLGMKAEVAKKWLGDGFKAMGSRLGDKTTFMRKLGIKLLGLAASKEAREETAEAAGKAVGEAGRRVGEFAAADAQRTGEDINKAKETGVAVYEHVSGKVKEGAKIAGEKAGEAWGRVVDAKDRALEWGHDQMDDICEKGRTARDAVAGKIQDVKLGVEVRAIMGKADTADREADKNLTGAESDEQLAQMLFQRAESRRAAAKELRTKAQELRAQAGVTPSPEAGGEQAGSEATA